MTHHPIVYTAARDDAGMRLDLFIARQYEDQSRSQIQKAIEDGHVLVNGRSSKTGLKLKAGDVVEMAWPEPKPSIMLPEAMDLDILYEDAHLLVLNKPAGLVVHPAAGHHSGTLVNGLLYHCRDLSGIGGVLRPGIVHRLDKDTSGLMIVAKTDAVHRALSSQFKARQVKKTYQAVVCGDVVEESGSIDLPVGRHPVERQKMSTRSRRGKEAITRWELKERYVVATLLDVLIETGRTHQIRVHFHAIGHPVVGDPVYGKALAFQGVRYRDARDAMKKMGRQALHAKALRFYHPVRQVELEFSTPLPADMAMLCDALRKDAEDWA